jgi:acyl-CoA thioester hydrolase
LKDEITYRGVVYPWHCDHMSHMNVMWYVGKFDEATWNLFTMLGLLASRLREEDIAMVAVEQHVEYKRELLAGDTLSVRSTILEVKDKVVRFRHEMRNGDTDEIAAITMLVAVCLDAKARKSRPLPADIRDKAQAMAASHGA